MNFDSLGLSEPILQAIQAANYTTPTPIQMQAIPPIAEGRDLLGCAQTGTGKTAAFAIPLIEQLHQARVAAAASADSQVDRGTRQPKVLVLSPTRELAIQINDSFRKYGKRTKLRSVVIYGGVGQRPQTEAVRRGVDVIVATPGRLLDLMNQGHVHLGAIQAVVLDEADHMLDMGFLPDVQKILGHLPKSRQTLLFSATMPPDIQKLAQQNMVDPVHITIAVDESNAADITESVYYIGPGAKPGFLIRFLKSHCDGTALVFSRTKRNADAIVERLDRAGVRAEAIHSNKSQNQRQRTLSAFRAGHVRVLVATDIAARGIDVRDISFVINYDLPESAETYTHRIGRTGRAGKPGIAITMCEAAKKKSLRFMERMLGYGLTEGAPLPETPGDEVVQPKLYAPATDDRSRSERKPYDSPRKFSKSSATAPKRGDRPAGSRNGKKKEWKPNGTAFKKSGYSRPYADKPPAAKSDNAPAPIANSSSDANQGHDAQPRRVKPGSSGKPSFTYAKPAGTEANRSGSSSRTPWSAKSSKPGKRPFGKRPATIEQVGPPTAKKSWKKSSSGKPTGKFVKSRDAEASGQPAAATPKTFAKKTWEKKPFEKKPFEKKPFEKKPFEKGKTFAKKTFTKKFAKPSTDQPAVEVAGSGTTAKRPTKRLGKKPSWKKSRRREDLLEPTVQS